MDYTIDVSRHKHMSKVISKILRANPSKVTFIGLDSESERRVRGAGIAVVVLPQGSVVPVGTNLLASM